MCLTLLMGVMTGCGGSDNKDDFATGNKTITIYHLANKAKFKNVTFFNEASGVRETVTISGTVQFFNNFTPDADKISFTYNGKTYGAKVKVSKDNKTIKVYYTDTKYDTYKKK